MFKTSKQHLSNYCGISNALVNWPITGSSNMLKGHEQK